MGGSGRGEVSERETRDGHGLNYVLCTTVVGCMRECEWCPFFPLFSHFHLTPTFMCLSPMNFWPTAPSLNLDEPH